MPKMKTHRGAAKRFKKTGSGKLKRSHAYKSYLRTNQQKQRKLRKAAIVHSGDYKRIREMLTYKK
ncbi:50S ribosomal protein L35 [Anaerobacillus sp. HL2]|nr:50S ribosomal protein L35 [Anaerobacillus sp. HL2]